MSQKEIDRYGIISRLLKKELNGTAAANLLKLSVRQVRRLKARVRNGGAQALTHQSRNQASTHRMPEDERRDIENLLQKRYPDFGPTFASEKLRECHRIARDPKTIRSVMIDLGLWRGRKQKNNTVHHWRERKAHPGELVQFDGSYEFWFEDRGPSMCLLAAIDDATADILGAEFAANEGVEAVFGFWKTYVERQGKPRAIYLDKFT